MINSFFKTHYEWDNLRIGITGASGSLGKALTKKFRSKGAFVIGFTSKEPIKQNLSIETPQQWVKWECGKETAIKSTLETLDILILNHGVNPDGQNSIDINQALEVNALSTWRLSNIYKGISGKNTNLRKVKELWINTSEAEIQPAFSPVYEITKRLIGQLISIEWSNLNRQNKSNLKIRKLILGPFLSELNPIGIMNASFVSNQIINQVELGISLVIVTPNPLTYLLMPLTEIFRFLYFNITNSSKS